MVDESGDNDSVGWPRIRPVDAAATAVPVPTRLGTVCMASTDNLKLRPNTSREEQNSAPKL